MTQQPCKPERHCDTNAEDRELQQQGTKHEGLPADRRNQSTLGGLLFFELSFRCG